MRRDHMKYLTLIRAVALLHQHQRELQDGRPTTGEPLDVHRGDARRTSGWPTGWPTRCWADRWTSCRRRPGGCSSSSTRWSRPPREARGHGPERRPADPAGDARGLGWGDTQLKVHLAGWWSWSTCWSTGAAAVRASCTSCSGTARAGTAPLPRRPDRPGRAHTRAPLPPGYDKCRGAGWSGVAGERSGSGRAPGRPPVGGWSAPPLRRKPQRPPGESCRCAASDCGKHVSGRNSGSRHTHSRPAGGGELRCPPSPPLCALSPPAAAGGG